MTGRWRLAGQLALAASGWVSFALTLVPPDPARAILAFGYVLFCPGLALVAAAEQVNGRRAADPLRRLTLAIAAGTACVALVCEGFYLASAFTLPRAAITLATITTAGALCPAAARWRDSRRAAAGPAPVPAAGGDAGSDLTLRK